MFDRILRTMSGALLLLAAVAAHGAAPACPTISVTPDGSHLPSAALQTAYSQSFSGGGSTDTPLVYSITSGLPQNSGLSLDPATGALSGTPLIGGEFFVTVTATDSIGCSGGRTYVLDVLPAVLDTTPINGATSIGINSAVTIDFTEAVNVGASAFSLRCPNGTAVPFTLSPAAPGDAASFTLTPTASLPHDQTCTVTVTAAQVTSAADGLAMASDYTFTFSTGSQPQVTSTTPASNATNVSTTSAITLTFNESVNASASAFTLQCPSGTSQAFTASASPATTFTLTPSAQLPAGAVCTVTAVAAQITDAATSSVHPAADYTFSFTVDSAPTVTSIAPATGAANVALNSTIVFNFNKTVTLSSSAAFTLQCPGGTSVPFTLTPAAPGNATTFTLTPTGSLPAGTTCIATAVASQIADQLGTPMSSDVSVSFTTDTAPTVSSTTPTNGATSVAGNTTVAITFNKAVNVTASAFTLQCPTGSNVAFTTSPTPPGNSTTFTLTPSTTLPAGTTCTVTVVASQVTDSVGTAMASNVVFSFTTDVAPTVTGTTPANGAMYLDTLPVSFTFSKPVNVTASAFTLVCGGSPVSFTVSPASPASAFTLTPTTFLPPGSSCVATAVASQIADVVGTHLAADVAIAFTAIPPPPVATNDTYPQTVVGNVSTNSALIPFSVTANDSSQSAFTITAYDSTSANGGTVTMITSGANIGQFTYNPPAGFRGTDSFTYTISNSGGSATATVSIPVAGMIWFINGAVTTAGDGRLSSPFNSLAAFAAINDGIGTHPQNNDSIFLYDAAINYVGPVRLLMGQKLIGQDATSTLSTISGIVPGTASAALPATGGGTPNKVNITSTSNTVTLGAANTVWGLTLGNANGTALTGSSAGSLKLRDLSIVNTAGAALSLTNAALDAILKTVSSTGGTHGILLSATSGSFDVEGDGASIVAITVRGRTTVGSAGTIAPGSGGTIQGASQSGILINGTSSVTLRNMVVQNNGSGVGTGFDGITVTNASAFVFDNGLVTGQTGNSGVHATNTGPVSILHSEIGGNATDPAVDGSDTWNVRLDNVTGTATITNSLLYNSHENVLGIVNTAATALAVTADNDDIHDSTSNSCFYTEADASANLSVSLTDSSVHVCPNVGFIYNGNESSGGGTITVTNNSFDSNGGNNSGGADLTVSHQGAGKTLTYDIENNTTRQVLVTGSGTSISVDLGGTSTPATLLTGKIAGNTIGKATVDDSGSQFGAGIALQANGAGTLTAVVNGNTGNQVNEGLAVLSSGTTDTLNVSVHSNAFHGNPSAGSANYAGMELTAGGNSGTDLICANVSGNTAFDATPGGAAGVIADALPNSTIQLQGYTGAANSSTAIQTFLSGTATTVTPAPLVSFGLGGTIEARTTCPPLP